MSRFFGVLSGVFLAFTTLAQADTVTRAAPSPLFVTPAGTLSPTRLNSPPVWPVRDTAAPVTGRIKAQSDISAFGFPCKTALNVTPKPGALLGITISAPCKPHEIVRVSHAGLSFDLALSLTGQALVTMPAMEKDGEIDTVFEDGTALSAPASAPELAEYLRVAVGWDQQDAHLQGDAPRFLPVEAHVLGDGSGGVVQILSHHLDPDSRAGVIRLSVHSTVTAQNCMASQLAQVMQHVPGAPAARYAVQLAKPGCNRVGDNLVLKNILPDMKLAVN